MEENGNKHDGVTFIDFLFTLAIWIGLVPESHNIGLIKNNALEPFQGIFCYKWLLEWTAPKGQDLIALLTFIACALTVILSWYGYHAALKKYPHKPNSLCGLFRFNIDVMLVLIYALLLIKFKNLFAVITLIVMIFVLYFLWDILLVCEYNKERPYVKRSGESSCEAFCRVYRGEIVTTVWLIGFLILWATYGILCKLNTVVFAIILLVTYRMAKIRPKSEIG